MRKIKSNDETLREFAHGYLTDCLYAWGAQSSNIRLFSMQATGAFLGQRGAPEFRGITDDAYSVLDELFIKLRQDHRDIMAQNFKYGRRLTIEQNAKILLIPYTTYHRRLQFVIRKAEEQLMGAADK